jgi:hypothetical protein
MKGRKIVARPKNQKVNIDEKKEQLETNITPTEAESVEPTPIPKRKVREQRDLNELVSVRNNLHSKLIYPSKIYVGNEFEWNEFGEENFLELRDLVSMRNSYPTYFRDCWVMVDDDILEYLGVKKYYENAINMENFDSIFNMKPDKLRETLIDLPTSMKSSVAQRAMQLKSEGLIDSVKILKVLSETLQFDLSF